MSELLPVAARHGATILERSTFQTSRLMEFFTEKELTMQIGAARSQWPVAVLKELIDNSLDACETAGIAPEITVTVAEDALVVQDNGPGLPAETLKHSLDYLVRVSDKAHYVSPTRGQLGNALKCVWAVPFVVNGLQGCVEVTTGGVTYCIDVTLDRIAQQPIIRHTVADAVVKNGTIVKILWPDLAIAI
jgi:DNA topoisomerase VI subunit B